VKKTKANDCEIRECKKLYRRVVLFFSSRTMESKESENFSKYVK